MKPANLPIFPGWKALDRATDTIMAGDALVCLNPYNSYYKVRGNPEGAGKIGVGSGWKHMTPQDAFDRGLHCDYYPYRKLARLPLNPHFSEPLPLP